MADFEIDPSAFNLFGPSEAGNWWETPASSGWDLFGPSEAPSWTDTLTGQTLTLGQIASDAALSTAFSQQFGTSPQAYTRMFSSPAEGGTAQTAPEAVNAGTMPSWWQDPKNLLAAGAIGLPTLLGLGGVMQNLVSGGPTGTTTSTTAAAPTPQQTAALGLALQGLQGAQGFALNPAGGLAAQLSALAPAQQQAVLSALAQMQQTQPIQGTQGALAGAVAPYLGQQGALLGLGGAGAQGLQNPAYGALMGQAQGMARGTLPALDPALRAQLDAVYAGRLQDVNRYVDVGVQGALERGRQQGYAGGLETFREGTPGALLAPILAEAVRQRGTLAGQQAQDEMALALGLPQAGGALAGQLFGQQAQQNQLLQGAAGGYTTPLSVALGGGTNLANLNQNILQALGGAGLQGMGMQNQFIGALTGASQGAGNLYGQGLGTSTQGTQQQPFNLLSAFAPTASLLGGIGGAMTGYGALTNPAQTSWKYNPLTGVPY